MIFSDISAALKYVNLQFIFIIINLIKLINYHFINELLVINKYIVMYQLFIPPLFHTILYFLIFYRH